MLIRRGADDPGLRRGRLHQRRQRIQIAYIIINFQKHAEAAKRKLRRRIFLYVEEADDAANKGRRMKINYYHGFSK